MSCGGLRKRKRAEKQRAIAWKYADDGPVGRLRAASKAERAGKRKEAAAHAAAEREKKRLAMAEGEPTGTQGETPEAKPARKTRHKGKGSGSGRRRPRRKSPCARKGRRLDRTLAGRKRGSKRWEDARVRRARHHAHIADHRREHNHRVSARCIARACALGIETLALAGLARGPLGKALLEAGLGMLLFQLSYKALWNDIPLVKCPRNYPSSQLCSHCGYQHRGLKLSGREWTCPQCGTRHHRDFQRVHQHQGLHHRGSAQRRPHHHNKSYPQVRGNGGVLTHARTPGECPTSRRRGGEHPNQQKVRRETPRTGNESRRRCLEQRRRDVGRDRAGRGAQMIRIHGAQRAQHERLDTLRLQAHAPARWL